MGKLQTHQATLEAKLEQVQFMVTVHKMKAEHYYKQNLWMQLTLFFCFLIGALMCF
jgi:hypothetical protein